MPLFKYENPYKKFTQECKDITDIITKMANYRKEELTVAGIGSEKFIITTKSLKHLAYIDMFSMTITPTETLKEWIKLEDELTKEKACQIIPEILSEDDKAPEIIKED